MTDLTPESIEAIEPVDIQRIRQLGWELHEATIGVKETPMSARDYEREEELRRVMGLKISEAVNELKRQVSDLEAVGRDLRTLKGWLSADKDALKSLKIERFVHDAEERRKNQSPHQSA